MDKFYITNIGLNYLSQVAEGKKIVFTRGRFGDGAVTSNIGALTDLLNPIGDMAISKMNVNEHQVSITTQFSNLVNGKLLDPFYLRELGLYGKLQNSDGSDNNAFPEKLIAYASCGTDQGDRIPGTLTEFIINWPCTVSNSENVSVEVSSLAYAKEIDLIEAKQELEKTKLSYQVVDTLPSIPLTFDFEDEKSLFSIPKQGTSARGAATIEVEDGTHIQKIVSSGSKSSTGVVYSSMKFGNVAEAKSMTIDFDYKCDKNGRMRIVLGDVDYLDNLNASNNNNVKYNYSNIAIDIFNNANDHILVNSADTITNSAMFGVWLHAKIQVDFATKKAVYSIVSKSNSSNRMSGSVEFRDKSLMKINGIAIYTWVAESICFDNIIVSYTVDNSEYTRYIVPNGSGGYYEYTYVDNVPVMIGSSEVKDIPELVQKSHSHSNKSVLDGITSSDISSWNLACEERHSHDNINTINAITEGNVTDWNAAANESHSHSNKSVLDSITSAKVNNWDECITNENFSNNNSKGYASLDELASDASDAFEGVQALKTYETIPQRIGTWIDGTPVWRAAISCTPADLGLTVTETSKACSIELDDIMIELNMINSSVKVLALCERINGWNEENATYSKSFSSDMIYDEQSHYLKFADKSVGGDPDYTQYITGYIEFATPTSNIKGVTK